MQDSARLPGTVRQVAEAVETVCQLAREQENFAWAVMLLRQKLHVLLWMAGRFDEAFSEALCADSLSYRSLDTGRRIEGREAVRAFFAARAEQGSAVIAAVRLRTAVDDWGVASEEVQRNFPAGASVDPAGKASIDELPMSVVSEFGADGRLLSIRVYPARTRAVVSLEAEDVVSPEQLAEACNALIARVRAVLADIQSGAAAAPRP